jgi:hypothetical protein
MIKKLIAAQVVNGSPSRNMKPHYSIHNIPITRTFPESVKPSL